MLKKFSEKFWNNTIGRIPPKVVFFFVGIFILISIALGYAYIDFPGVSSPAGRTKNALATVITGALANELYPDREVEIEIRMVKLLWYPNSRVSGQASSGEINVYNSNFISLASFSAKKDSDGVFRGEVAKTEYNWSVSKGEESWEIGRFLDKLDTALVLEAKDGKISGYYSQSLSYDWIITGTYDSDGNIQLDCDHWTIWGFGLEGKIVPK